LMAGMRCCGEEDETSPPITMEARVKHKDGEEVVDEAGDVPMHVLRY
jgi:hypothetical protein